MDFRKERNNMQQKSSMLIFFIHIRNKWRHWFSDSTCISK